MSNPQDIPGNLQAITARMAAACVASGRTLPGVTMVAVSKTQPPDVIDAALGAGVRCFGENRVQEAQGRWAHRRDIHPDLKLHLIGPLQTNKAVDAVKLFDVIETVDRPDLIKALAKAFDKTGASLPCLIQVNTGQEPQKAGVPPALLPDLLAQARMAGLDITGLMCIPPVGAPPSLHFALLAQWARRLGLAHLSMGMSGDFEEAIRCGATHVRLGSLLFGERDKTI